MFVLTMSVRRFSPGEPAMVRKNAVLVNVAAPTPNVGVVGVDNVEPGAVIITVLVEPPEMVAL